MSKISKVVTIVIVAVVSIGAGVALGWYLKDRPQDNRQSSDISSFEECAAANHPILESHPRQCAVPGGATFTEDIDDDITYQNANSQDIKITNPQPGATVEREFEVTGQAVGAWFFEASFTVEVVAPSGDRVAQTIVNAEGDWMQEGLVNFKSEIVQLPSAYEGEATLILRKNNPSGLPQNDASVSIPITVKH